MNSTPLHSSSHLERPGPASRAGAADRLESLPASSRYLFAVGAVAATALVRWALVPVLGHEAPLLLFTLPVVLVALYWGPAPALLTTLFSAAIGSLMFITGLDPGGVVTLPDQVRVSIFLVFGVTVSVLAGRLSVSRERERARAQELARVAEKLQEADRRKDEFIAMLGHELRNPLAAISSAGELVRLTRNDEPRHGRACATLKRQVTHMSDMLNDLLDVSRITRGLFDLRRRHVDLKDLVYQSVEQCQKLLDNRQHHLQLQLPADPVLVHGDHTRLVQVVSNLLSNAAKYTANGGLISLSLSRSGDWATLEVRDNGMGISAELMPHIFEAFIQSKRTLDRAQGGLGLGLPVVKGIVEMHGGTVSAHSEGVHKGSLFRVVLPCQPVD